MTGWRWVVGIVLLAHGIGHVLGLIPLFAQDSVKGWDLHSWMLTDAVGESVSKAIGAALFAAGTIIFVLAGLAVLGWGVPIEWWKPLAVAGATVSTLAVVLFWNAFPALVPNKIGALAVNVVILGNWINVWAWPTDEMLDQAASVGTETTV